MAESFAISHKYGGTENLLSLNMKWAVRQGIYVNVMEILRYGYLETKLRD